MSLPLVAIVGAPNVGKSTLFNRLVGARRSIVTDKPGVTRDRLYGTVRDAGRPFGVIDTGGLTIHGEAPFAREIESQAGLALDEADLVLLIVDARAGLTALDQEIADMLRRRGDEVLLVANKVDGPNQESELGELHRLGFGAPLSVAAEHKLGLGELVDAVVARLDRIAPAAPAVDDEGQRPVRISIVGRPNVGKSSLLNRLVGAERMMVSQIAGTTRDSVDTLLERDGRRYLLVDTAGIRRRGKVKEVAEHLSVVLAKRAVARADVVALVLDAGEPFAAQDAHIAGLAVDAHRPIVVLVNKWDLVEGREEAVKRWEEELRRRLRFVKGFPILFVSALSGQRVTRLLEAADELHRTAGRRIGTSELNRWLETVARGERASPAGGRSVNLLYATQTGVHPPTIVVFCSDPKGVHFSLRRFLENSLRREFGFSGTPIRLRFRGRRGVC